MRARHCPRFAFSTALSRPSPGFLASSGWHFSMPRKQAGVSHLRSDYPLIFMSFSTVLLGRCRWSNSAVVSAFGQTWLRRQDSRRLGFHRWTQVDDHGWISFVARDCHRRCCRIASVSIIGIRSFRQFRCPCHRVLAATCNRRLTSTYALVVPSLFLSSRLVRTRLRVSVHMPNADSL
jgi:hypothetical protein